MQFDSAALSTLATKAILDSMTPETREQLLVRAVAGLFEKSDTDKYKSNPRTKFEEAFDDALLMSMRVIVRELIAEPRYQDAIKPLLAAAVDKALLGENRERLVSLFENAIDEGLTKLRGY